MPTPSSGVCAPWTTTALVQARPHCATLDSALIATACMDASNILWALTRRKFSGVCNGYVRPIAKPRSFEERSWTMMHPYGYNNTWGACDSGHQMGYSAQCFAPPEIDLGVYPLVSITQVLIDGVVIPSTEYRIDNNKLLTRVLPTAASSPTEIFGWPVCQRYDLPDTETGTFSVAYTFGMMPPSEGISAATALAAQFAIARTPNGPKSSLPERITSITRQQMTLAILDPMTFLDKGLTGIYETDLFIRAHNPEGSARRRGGVWSPDMAANRRPT